LSNSRIKAGVTAEHLRPRRPPAGDPIRPYIGSRVAGSIPAFFDQ
jgi:hypothetical protein